jgi:hypothetical protein
VSLLDADLAVLIGLTQRKEVFLRLTTFESGPRNLMTRLVSILVSIRSHSVCP